MGEVFNFSAGPAMMPAPVLEKAERELRSIGGSGMSVMEVSHRSRYFEPILERAEQGIRHLMQVPENYRVLFLQGGASFQFSMVPINFLGKDQRADYVITGAWGIKAVTEARRCGQADIIFSSEATGFRSVPDPAE
jgi:phosphoserine aminotransferase